MTNEDLVKAFKQVKDYCDKRKQKHPYCYCTNCKYSALSKADMRHYYCMFKYDPSAWTVEECRGLKLKR